jgi:hypothetical protein
MGMLTKEIARFVIGGRIVCPVLLVGPDETDGRTDLADADGLII